MRTALSLLAVTGLSLSLTTASMAKHRTSRTARPKCQACGMKLSSTKTKATPKAVKIGKKTYFCCAGCDMTPKKTTP
jgi:hypothetical protein